MISGSVTQNSTGSRKLGCVSTAGLGSDSRISNTLKHITHVCVIYSIAVTLFKKMNKNDSLEIKTGFDFMPHQYQTQVGGVA